MPSPQKQSSIHAAHVEHGAVMAHKDGWAMTERYADLNDEVGRVQQGVGLIDRSDIIKIDLKSSTLQTWIKQTFDADIKAQEACRGITADGTVRICCSMRVDWGLMIVPTPHTAERVDTLMEQTHGELHVTDVSSVYTALQLVGPRCLDVLQKLTSLDLRPSLLSNLTCKQGTIAKVPGLMLRDDLAAYPSYWIFITREYGEFVWETICDVGKACDLIPMGSETYRCLTTKNSNYGDPS